MEKKQHPLDRLFGEKLRNHEVAPREAAWEKLQSRLPQPAESRTRPLWGRWAVAASVAALIGAGLWVWQGYQPIPDRPDLADVSSAKPMKPSRGAATPESAVASPSGSGIKQTDLANTERPQIARYPSVNRDKESGTESPGDRKSSPSLESIRPASAESLVPLEQSASPQQLAMAEKTPATQPKVPETTASVFVLHVTEPSVLAEATVEPEAVPEEQVAQMETGKPKKGKFLNRMVKNLKHIKQGEWKEAGLDANGLLARAEDKLLRK